MQSFDILEESTVVIIRDPGILAHRTFFSLLLRTFTYQDRGAHYGPDCFDYIVYSLKGHDVSSCHVNLCPLHNLFHLQQSLYYA